MGPRGRIARSRFVEYVNLSPVRPYPTRSPLAGV
jgi:hypothetical protein